MQIRQIQYFLKLCEELNFTQAAERCHVTQPSLTNGIRRLERHLGGPLFDRHRSGVRLTKLAVTVKPYLEQIVANARLAQELAQSGRHAEGQRPGDEVGYISP